MMHSHFTMTFPSFHFTTITHTSHPPHSLLPFTTTSLHLTLVSILYGTQIITFTSWMSHSNWLFVEMWCECSAWLFTRNINRKNYFRCFIDYLITFLITIDYVASDRRPIAGNGIGKDMHGLLPITVAAQSEPWTVFACSNAGIVGSNPTQGMDVCVRLFCVYVLCVGLMDAPSKESYRPCIGLRNWKAAKVQQGL
jgi:hypothetical protein